MFKMSSTCHHHGQSIFIAIINAQLVFDGASWLNHTFNARFVRNLHTIREWEERITGHHGTVKIKITLLYEWLGSTHQHVRFALFR